MPLELSDFDYRLPDRFIAQTPIAPRDTARLLVDRGDESPLHRRVDDLPDLLEPGDLLVVNDTRVIPARLALRRDTGGAAEALLLEPVSDDRRHWEALVRPGGKLRLGEELYPNADAARDPLGAHAPGTGVEPIVRMGERTQAGDTFEIELLGDLDPMSVLDRHGTMPLPPYIGTRLDDQDRYQTIYAAEPGSAAAPTAGLHFTDRLFERIADRGVSRATVELVVGLDTFQPISTPDPLDHPMHTERYRVPQATWDACRATRERGGRVVAIGTTAVRALESAAVRGELAGRTDLFISRGFEWQVVDAMMTNFHLPRTTLLMMIDAFIGPRWRSLYETALASSYRFLSFGDAMLLTKDSR